MREALLAITVAALLVGSGVPAGARELVIGYSHAYFVLAPDDMIGPVWEPGEVIAWSRWSFVPEGPSDLFPIELNVGATGFQLDPTISHKPPLRISGPSTYACTHRESGTDVTFSTTERPRVDPGVRITRVVTPELIPPGTSEVRVRVVVTLVRRPAIDGLASPVRAAWIHVLWNLSDGLAFVRGIRLDPGTWQPMGWPMHDRSDYGFILHSDALPPGTFFTFSAVLTVENRSGQAILFLPSVGVEWLRDTFPLSQVSGRVSDAEAASWAVGGPQGGELRVAFSVQPGKSCSWHLAPTLQHSIIWVYWLGKVGRP